MENILKKYKIPIAIALVPITWLVMAVAGRVTQIIMDRRARNG